MESKTDEAAAFHWPEGTEHGKMVMPGDNVEMICETYNPLAVETGQRFNIREGGRYVSPIIPSSASSISSSILPFVAPFIPPSLSTEGVLFTTPSVVARW